MIANYEVLALLSDYLVQIMWTSLYDRIFSDEVYPNQLHLSAIQARI